MCCAVRQRLGVGVNLQTSRFLPGPLSTQKSLISVVFRPFTASFCD